MITPKELFKAKPLPRWLTSHKLFAETKKIHKVFPSIGLPNTEEDCEIDNGGTASVAANLLLDHINAAAVKRKANLLKFKETHPKMSDSRSKKLSNNVALLNSIIELIGSSKKEFLTKTKNGKITINFPQDIIIDGSDKPIFKKGEGVFRGYGKLNELLKDGKFATMSKIEDVQAFKQFSTDNIPATKYKVVFSSSDANGLWDIATMSMRGVQSCQSWDGQYRKCLIGSILDPFVGIIYLTSGGKFNKYGSKMIKRCVVRFAIHEKDHKPYIVLDHMYPQFDQSIADAFINFIKTKTDNKFGVVSSDSVYYSNTNRDVMSNLYIPYTELRKKLGNRTNENHDTNAQYERVASYQDSHIKTKKPEPKDTKNSLFVKNSNKKIQQFSKLFSDALTEVIKNVSIDQFPDLFKPTIAKLSGQPLGKQTAWNYSQFMAQFSTMIAKDIIKSVNRDDFNNSDTYIRRVYYAYLMRKDEILDIVKSKLVKEINSNLDLKKKLKGEQLLNMLKLLLPKVDIIMKEKLKELATKQKAKFSGAAPLPIEIKVDQITNANTN
jgi:hypothetical protein